jgi:hypothetical protein
MIALTDQYLAALVRHDPAGLPLFRGVRFTENTAEIRIGDGLWVGEIEHILARNMRADRMQNLITPRAAFLADVPPAERTSREDMINAANSYFEAIEHGDGEIAPFAEDCERHENGAQTTHNAASVPWPVPMGSPEADHAMAIIGTLSCSAQLNSQVMSFITLRICRWGRFSRSGAGRFTRSKQWEPACPTEPKAVGSESLRFPESCLQTIQGRPSSRHAPGLPE